MINYNETRKAFLNMVTGSKKESKEQEGGSGAILGIRESRIKTKIKGKFFQGDGSKKI